MLNVRRVEASGSDSDHFEAALCSSSFDCDNGSLGNSVFEQDSKTGASHVTNRILLPSPIYGRLVFCFKYLCLIVAFSFI